MKKNNKKGFTLIELLAVIVVLAIIAAVSIGVIGPRIAQARKDGFVEDLDAFVSQAPLYFNDHPDKQCVKIKNLIGEYVSVKKDKNLYDGYIYVSNGTTYVTATDGTYYISAADTGNQTSQTAASFQPFDKIISNEHATGFVRIKSENSSTSPTFVTPSLKKTMTGLSSDLTVTSISGCKTND